MKADLRISIKDYHRNKNLKIQLSRVPFTSNRQFWVRMNGEPWPKDGRPVSLTRLLTALRKSLVKWLIYTSMPKFRSKPDEVNYWTTHWIVRAFSYNDAEPSQQGYLIKRNLSKRQIRGRIKPPATSRLPGWPQLAASNNWKTASSPECIHASR
jgi:hypothetical protein